MSLWTRYLKLGVDFNTEECRGLHLPPKTKIMNEQKKQLATNSKITSIILVS
jgi:hypothetical protein